MRNDVTVVNVNGFRAWVSGERLGVSWPVTSPVARQHCRSKAIPALHLHSQPPRLRDFCTGFRETLKRYRKTFYMSCEQTVTQITFNPITQHMYSKPRKVYLSYYNRYLQTCKYWGQHLKIIVPDVLQYTGGGNYFCNSLHLALVF